MVACVQLPWPPVASSPNGSQAGFYAKASAGKRYKADCWKLCRAEGLHKIEADAVEVSVIFQPPSARSFDLDNMLARTKRGLDAVAEAIGVDDSRWTSITLERGCKTPGGAVVVSITPAVWRPVGLPARLAVSRAVSRSVAE